MTNKFTQDMTGTGHYVYGIEYEPRIEDPVIVARFDNKDEAEQHMEKIRTQSPKAAKHHRIIEETTKEWQKLYGDIASDPEPERYYDWMLWKLKQKKEEGQ